MEFEWDEAKNPANVKKHGFDLADAEEMFRGVLVVDPDTRGLWRETLGGSRNNRRSRCICSFCRERRRDYSDHLVEKG